MMKYEPIVSMKTLAEKLGVSISTVSLALNYSARVNCQTGKKVREFAQEMGYAPNNFGRALQSGKSRMIGCLLNSVMHSFFNEVLEGMGQQATGDGYCLLTAWGGRLDLRARLDQLLRHRIEGIILVGSRDNFREIIPFLEKIGMEFVFCSTHGFMDYPTVVTDDTMGGAMAAEYMLKCGHCNILIQDFPTRERLEGARSVLRDARYQTFREPEEVPSLIAQTKATAVIAFSDIVAIDVMYLLRRRGFHVPEDVSVIGYDNLPIAARPEFDLTTIEQQREQIGRTSVDYLLRKVEGENLPLHVLLEPRLVERSTVAKR